jgi:hypothetical protein
MPDQFRIKVQADADIIRSRSRGKHPIVCPIAICIGSRCFPHPDWDDFALTILDWWLQQVVELQRGNSRVADLQFMDGPVSVRMTPSSASLWKVECLRQGRETIVEIAGECDPAQIKSEIVAAIRQVLSGVREAGLSSEGCSKLEAALP